MRRNEIVPTVLTAVIVVALLYCTQRLERALDNIDSRVYGVDHTLTYGKGTIGTYPTAEPRRNY